MLRDRHNRHINPSGYAKPGEWFEVVEDEDIVCFRPDNSRGTGLIGSIVSAEIGDLIMYVGHRGTLRSYPIYKFILVKFDDSDNPANMPFFVKNPHSIFRFVELLEPEDV